MTVIDNRAGLIEHNRAGVFIAQAHEFGAIKEPNSRAVFTRCVSFQREKDARAFWELTMEAYPNCRATQNGCVVHLPHQKLC